MDKKELCKLVCKEVVKHADTPTEVRLTKHVIACALGISVFLPEWMVVPYTVCVCVVQLYKL